MSESVFPRHILSLRELDRSQIESLFSDALAISKERPGDIQSVLAGKVLGVMFFQPSTRTRLNFEVSMIRLGGSVIGFSDVKVTRGGDFFNESLEDMVRMVGGMTDGIVLRHYEDNAAQRVSGISPVPIINAGDGGNEHPTQALCDLWMLWAVVGKIDGTKVALIGDPGCRATRSMLIGLLKFNVGEVLFLPPSGVGLPEDVRDMLMRANTGWRVHANMDNIIAEADIIWMIPFVLPSFNSPRVDGLSEQGPLEGKFRLTSQKIRAAGRRPFILHTGPRGRELDTDLDDLPEMLYFRQVRAAIPLRMAILAKMMAPGWRSQRLPNHEHKVRPELPLMPTGPFFQK